MNDTKKAAYDAAYKEALKVAHRMVERDHAQNMRRMRKDQANERRGHQS